MLPDLCAPPTSITASTVADLAYTISDFEQKVSFDAFTVEPSFCNVVYTTEIVDLINTVDTAVTVAAAPEADKVVTFDIEYVNSLVPYTASESQTCKVIATATSIYTTPAVPLTEEGSFDVTFLNPCVNQAFTVIVEPALPRLDYILESGSETFAAHPVFTYTTEKLQHQLCGDFTYTGKFEGTVVDGDPLAYNAGTRQFTADSDDVANLLDQLKDYSVYAEFTDWPLATNPTVDTGETQNEIDFGNACEDPFSFSASAQTDPVTDGMYDSVGVLFNLNKFNIAPPRCEITYACTNVVKVGLASASPLTCTDLPFDGKIDGQPSDGVMTFTPTKEDYVNQVIPPGDYTVTITGTVAKKPTLSDDATFTITVVDICDPPSSLDTADLTDQLYPLTKTDYANYTPTGYVTIVPDFCPYTTAISTTLLTNTESAITEASGVFSFLYSKEIDTTTESQTTTITVTHDSIYTATSTPAVTSSTDFVTTFDDPCVIADLLTITSKPQTAKLTDNYSGTDQVFTYDPFTVVPDWCDLTIECNGVTGPSDQVSCVELVSNSATYNYDGDAYTRAVDPVVPGIYTISYKIYSGPTADVTGLQETFSFELELVDPCLSATVTPATSSAQTYTVTQAS